MLERFRTFVKRLELPTDEDDLVYRIIDKDRNAIEATPAEYGNWRLRNDVTKLAIVGQDSIEDVLVRTTFSVMPESRIYKPFGTSVYRMPSYEPLTQYAGRYDTWREAELGHGYTLDRIRRDMETALLADQQAEALAGTAGEARLSISANLPTLFQVSEHSDGEVTILTPLLRADGIRVELKISQSEGGFLLNDADESVRVISPLPDGEQGTSQLQLLCSTLRLTIESGSLVCRVDDASHLGQGIVRLAQGIASVSMMDRPQS